MSKNLTITIVSLSPFLVPQLAYACGGNIFSIQHWMIYIMFALFLLHCFILYLLNKKTNLLIKEKIVQKYSHVIFHIHFSVPIIVALIIILSRVAFACIDLRSQQEKFIDGLFIPFGLVVIISSLISAIFFTRINSKKLTPENKVRLGKIVATSLCVITLITSMYLSYAFWVVAPTLPDTSPMLTIPSAPIP